MKKIKLLLPIVVLILFLSFSFLMRPSVNAATILETPATDEEKVARSLENIKNNMPSNAIASFPVAYIGGFDETIEFSSDTIDVIDVSHINETEGWVIVHRDAVTEENKKVTITITVTLNEKSLTETKEVVVPMGTTNSQKFNVTYDGVTESEHSNVTEHTAGNYVKLTDATKDGYIFDGWFINNKKVTCLPVGIYKDITVTAKFTKIELKEIEITTQPTKLIYTALEDFDKTGLVVTAKYNDNSTKDVTDNVTFDKTTLYGNDSSVEVSYTEGVVTKKATINVAVNKILVTTPKVENKYSYVYDGKVHSVEIENSDSSKYSISYEGTNSLTNVRTESIKVKFTLTDSTNYELDKTEFDTTLEVTQKEITIVVDDKTSIYGANLNDLTCTIKGLVDGESLQFDLAKEDGTDVGTYNITISQKSNENYSNYKFDLSGLKGTYTITKAQLKVIPNSITINLGAQLPEVTVKFDGFVNNEDEAVLNGSLTTDITNKVDVNIAGTYKYTITGYSSENYEIVFVEGTVIVNETTVDIELEETATEYDGTTKNVTAIFKDGEQIVNPENIDYTYSKDGSPVESIKDAGTYTILVSFEDATLGKGSKEFTYTVNKKNVTITVNEQRFEYTGSAISFDTTNYSSTLTNEDLGTITVVLKDPNSETKDLGSYDLTVSYTENLNYKVNVIEGKLIIFLSDNDKVNKAANELDDKYKNVLTGTIYDIDDLTIEAYEANIEWTSDNALISIDKETGKVTITKGNDDQIDVILTAKISSGEEWTSRDYSFTFSFVKEKGTEENPYTASEAYNAANDLVSNTGSEKKVYVKGIVKSIIVANESRNSYTLEISDSDETIQVFKIYSSSFDSAVEVAIVGSEIIAYGYLYKYYNTPELSGEVDNEGNVTLEYPIIKSVTTSDEAKFAADKKEVENKLDSYATLSSSTSVKLITNATYGSIVTYSSSNPDVLKIEDDGTITINPPADNDEVVTITYTTSLNGQLERGFKNVTVKKAGSAEEKTLEINSSYITDFTNKYNDYSGSVSDISIKFAKCFKGEGSCIQGNSNKLSFIYNETAIQGFIKSISIEFQKTGTKGITVYGDNSALSVKGTGTKIGTLKDDLLTITFNENYNYFQLVYDSGASYIKSITIIYE